MKIGLFTDSHYSQKEISDVTRRPHLSYEKIGEALRAFRSEGVELIICLGDLIDHENNELKDRENLSHISVLLASSGIETLCIMGNHDAFTLKKDRFKLLSGMTLAPCHKVYGDVDIILLDANYFKDGRAYDGTPGDWTNCMIPQKEVDWFREELASCGSKTYVFTHQNIDYNIEQNHVVENAEQICGIIGKSGKVRAVYQGHYHPGDEHIIDGVPYVTLKAMGEGWDNLFLIIDA